MSNYILFVGSCMKKGQYENISERIMRLKHVSKNHVNSAWIYTLLTTPRSRLSVALSLAFRRQNHCNSPVRNAWNSLHLPACCCCCCCCHIFFRENHSIVTKKRNIAHNWMYCLSLSFHLKWHWASRFFSLLNNCVCTSPKWKSCQTNLKSE